MIAYHVYSNSGMGGPINYINPVVTTASTTWTSQGLAFPGAWKFAVRAFDTITGLEEQNIDAAVAFTISTGGRDISARPDPPVGILAIPLAGGSIRVEWSYPNIHGGNPTGFHVYIGTGGSPSYSSPVATVTASGAILGRYSTTLNGLTLGLTYAIGVRAFNGSGEESNTRSVSVLLKSAAPTAVVGLTATATAID